MEAAKIMADLRVFFAQMIKRIVEAVGGLGKTCAARSLEAYVEEQCKALGAVALETCLRLRMKSQTPPSALSCACGRRKHCLGSRPREVQAVLGKIQLEERYYYRCDQCGAVEYLGDEFRGASTFSPLAEERIAIAGKEGAFANVGPQRPTTPPPQVVQEGPGAGQDQAPALLSRGEDLGDL